MLEKIYYSKVFYLPIKIVLQVELNENLEFKDRLSLQTKKIVYCPLLYQTVKK